MGTSSWGEERKTTGERGKKGKAPPVVGQLAKGGEERARESQLLTQQPEEDRGLSL